MSDKINLFNNKTLLSKCQNWLKRFPNNKKRSAVIEVLKIIQNENNGFLNEHLIGEAADFLEIPKIYAYEVATFYSMFDLTKTGRHKIYLCISISCMLCGSDEIVLYIKNKLGINFNQTTPDGRFTLKKTECLGSCGSAPVMLIGEKYYENLNINNIDSILDNLE